MKYVFYILCFGVLMLAPACDDFLEVKPESRVVPDDFLDSELEVEQGVTAIYRGFRDLYVAEQWKWTDLRSDNTSNDTLSNLDRPENIDQFLINAGEELIRTYWLSSYNGINRCNIVIDALVNPDPALRFEQVGIDRRYEAEARFFRAFFYFNLVRLFGDVPVVDFTFEGLDDLPDFAGLRRQPVADIFTNVIIPDLEMAIENLPQNYGTTQIGRVTRGAALTLLGDAHLTRGDYQAAIETLELVNDLGYSLNANYADNFNPATKNGPESIFELQFDIGASQPSGFFRNWVPANSGGEVFSSINARGEAGNNQPTLDMTDAYEPGDNRADVSIAYYFRKFTDPETNEEDSVRVPFIGKYNYELINESGISGQDVNWPVYRYADVLLMLAEAYNENEPGNIADAAILYLNRVRIRAGLDPYIRGTDFNTTEELRLLILQERRVELAFESKRWFDLQRVDARVPNFAIDLMNQHAEQEFEIKGDQLDGGAYSSIQLLLGLPQEEVILYDYVQNEGWEL